MKNTVSNLKSSQSGAKVMNAIRPARVGRRSDKADEAGKSLKGRCRRFEALSKCLGGRNFERFGGLGQKKSAFFDTLGYD